nr:MAG TPA: hypothetical protein [Caudoviricetes sp.]
MLVRNRFLTDLNPYILPNVPLMVFYNHIPCLSPRSFLQLYYANRQYSIINVLQC